MKHGYKLLGAFWDGMPTSENINYLENSDFINKLYDEYNLFDLTKIRKINISEILRIKSSDAIAPILTKMEEYESILLNIDYFPSNENKILNNFYFKRINQIYTYISYQLNNIKVYLSTNFKNY